MITEPAAVGPVEIRLLGPVEASVAGRDVGLGGRNPKVVMSLLALASGHVVSADRLGEAVWGPEAVERSATTLQVHVSNLRRALDGRRVITSTAGGYRLDPTRCRVDVDVFESAIEEARTARAGGRPEAAIAALADGLGLWRGRALADVEGSEEIDQARHHLEERRLLAVDEHLQDRLDAGEHTTLVPELESLVAEHPFREQFLGRLMIALYRSGRQRDALHRAQEGRRRLAEELGLEPGPEITRLERSILVQSPSIDFEPSDEGPSLRWIDGDGTARRLRLDPLTAPFAVGRDADLPVSLTHDAAVSRRHAEIDCIDGAWWVIDGGSTNGTRVNGLPVEGRASLVDGATLRFGETTLLVRLESSRERFTPGLHGPTVPLP